MRPYMDAASSAGWQYHDSIIPGNRGPELYTRRAGRALEVFITETSPDPYDWLMNFHFGQVRLWDDKPEVKRVKVHAGFLTWAYMAYPTVYDQADDAVAVMRFYGASAGGAVAILLAAMFKAQYPHRDVKATLYGAPAAGNKHFARHCQAMLPDGISRIYAPLDIVANAPYWLTGLRHAGAKHARKSARRMGWLRWVQNHRDICASAYRELGI